MNDPFTEPREKGAPPYWLRDEPIDADAAKEAHLRLLAKAEAMHGPRPFYPNPLSRSWHP